MTPSTVTAAAATVALVLLTPAIVLCLARALKGPTTADRVVALDVLSFLAVGVIAALAYANETYPLLDAAAVPALVGFIATAAFARHLEGRRRDSEDGS